MIQLKFTHLFLVGVIAGLSAAALVFVTMTLDISGADIVTVRNTLFYSGILFGVAFACLGISMIAVIRNKVA